MPNTKNKNGAFPFARHKLSKRICTLRTQKLHRRTHKKFHKVEIEPLIYDLEPKMTLIELKIHFTEQLKGDFPATEIESFFRLLVEEYLNMDRLQTSLNAKMELGEKQHQKFLSALNRLKNHEPVQYIIGKTEFYGMDFKVNPNVLIPRPETEELVNWILNDVEANNRAASFSILDIGTGSACIAVSLAKKMPGAALVAMDFSEKALKTAKQNAELHQVSVNFLQKDILKLKELPQKFDIIVSNPPYVRELEKTKMQRNVLEHEPNSALYVKNEDPLIFYRKIAGLAKKNLTKNGAAYLEINQYLGKETQAVFTKNGFKTKLGKDIFGNHRMLKAWQ